MDCEFTEKVSLLLDGELTASESVHVREHVRACRVCQQAEADFLRLRRELKAYDFEPQPFVQARTLARILKGEKPPLWRRRVSLPLPLMGLLVAVVVVLALWSVSLRRASSVEVSRGEPVTRTPVAAPPRQAEAAKESGLDFSQYDHGERAAIYKVRRIASATDAQPQ